MPNEVAARENITQQLQNRDCAQNGFPVAGGGFWRKWLIIVQYFFADDQNTHRSLLGGHSNDYVGVHPYRPES
jgi:hypothetical protein